MIGKTTSFLKKISDLVYSDIVKRNKTTPFLIFVSLLFWFIVSRLFVMYFPGKSVFIKGYHIHHFFFGLILLSLAGYIAIVSKRAALERLSAIMYGSGAGMLLDEIGLFLTCGTMDKGCDYWARVTFDVFIIVVSLFLAIIYFGPFWRRMGKPILSTPKRVAYSVKKRL
jgi:hypothetical protein